MAPGLPIAKVATGTPFGIWTVASNESIPSRSPPPRGIPRTGFVVWAAIAPARWAAIPAAAIKTWTPLASDSFIFFTTSSGVLCAERINILWVILNSLRISDAN